MVFFDAISTGHHGEYIENLLVGLPEAILPRSVFVIHPALRERCEACMAETRRWAKIDYLTNEQVQQVDYAWSRGAISLGRLEWRLARSYATKHRAGWLLLLYMNRMQLPLIGGWHRREPRVRGILFNPLSVQEVRTKGTRRWKPSWRRWRKLLQLYGILRNPSIDRIFYLNNRPLAEWCNRVFRRRGCFDSVCDPIPWAAATHVPKAPVERREDPRRQLLLFGSLEPRKGITELLRAIASLAPDIGSRARLRIVGRVLPGKGNIEQWRELAGLANRASGMEIEVVEGFLSYEDLAAEVRTCDYVLAPYLGSHGSSGVLGHACLHRKPLLACAGGQIGAAVREGKLGLTFDPRDRQQFADTLRRAILHGVDVDAARMVAYVQQADYRAFAQKLVEGVA